MTTFNEEEEFAVAFDRRGELVWMSTSERVDELPAQSWQPCPEFDVAYGVSL